MSELRVAIAGAGIGGLVAALALSRIDCEVSLIERRTGFGEAGAGIQLSPNASRILIDLGLEAPLRRIASEPPSIVVRDARSACTIGTVALGRFAAVRYGAPYLVVQRSDLQTLLLDAVRSRGIPLLMGRRAMSAAIDGACARVTVETGSGVSSLIEADLAVAADGLWSSLHAGIDRREPIPAGYSAWRATIARALAPKELGGNEIGLWLGRRTHVVHYPIASGTLVNIVAIARTGETVDGWSAPGNPEEIEARFADQAAPLRSLIDAASDWRVWSLYDRPAGVAGRGRLALIGDAAHPVLPFLAQGGAMAIEDAAILAQSIARHGADVSSATRLYARERLSRVVHVQRAARRNGRIYHLTGPAAFARNLVMRRLGAEGMIARYDWLYGWRPGAPADPA